MASSKPRQLPWLYHSFLHSSIQPFINRASSSFYVTPMWYMSWVFFGRTDAKAETPILWPPHAKSWLIGRLSCWEGLGAGGEGDDRGWDGWMASPTRWAWVWVNSGSWWWTGRPGVLRFMGSKESDTTERLNWTELNYVVHFLFAYLVSVTFNDVDDSLEPGIFLFLLDYNCFIMFC